MKRFVWTPEFGDRLQLIVSDLGGQQRAGEVIGRARQTIGNWENKPSEPGLFDIATLCAEAGYPLSYLLGDSSEHDQDREVLEAVLRRIQEVRQRIPGREVVEDLPPGELRAHPVLSIALDWFYNTNGRLGQSDQAAEEFIAFSVIHTLGARGTPEYLMCGAGSVVAAYYGAEFAKNPKTDRSVVDTALEDRASRFYRRVEAEGVPISQSVGTPVTIKGIKRWLCYDRLAMPIEIKGMRAIMVIARETAPPKLLS